ncbi:hypothetical protein EDB85DRAFT_1888134 [Lactarius pseudohatsudake]|nr:hypothetical protein EDB85DRAFT_1888134 [Lactarius pseudohatsudake]
MIVAAVVVVLVVVVVVGIVVVVVIPWLLMWYMPVWMSFAVVQAPAERAVSPPQSVQYRIWVHSDHGRVAVEGLTPHMGAARSGRKWRATWSPTGLGGHWWSETVAHASARHEIAHTWPSVPGTRRV